MRSMLLPGLVIAAALLLAACGDPATGAYASGEYEPADPASPPAAKPTRSAITGPDGERVVQETGSEVAVSLPKGFSLYPQALVISNTVTRSAKASQSTLMFRTTDAPADIAEFYKAQAEKAGMDITIDLNFDEHFTIAGDRATDGTQMTVTASREVGEEVSTAMLNMVSGR